MQMVLGFHGRGRIIELRHSSTTSRPRPTPLGRDQHGSIYKAQIIQSSTPVHRTYKINPKPTLTPVHKINTQTDTKSTRNQPQHQYTKSTHQINPKHTSTPVHKTHTSRPRSTNPSRDRQAQPLNQPPPRRDRQAQPLNQPPPRRDRQAQATESTSLAVNHHFPTANPSPPFRASTEN